MSFAFSKTKTQFCLLSPLIITFQTRPFQSLVKKGTNHVFQGKMVTFGIHHHAQDRLWLPKLDDDGSDEEGASIVTQFIEKPKNKSPSRC